MVELRINEILKEKDMSMTDLAKKVGINRVNLYTSLNGNPTYSRLKEVADALGVGIEELFPKENSRVSICGFVEVDGDIYKVASLSQLKELVETIEDAIALEKKKSNKH